MSEQEYKIYCPGCEDSRMCKRTNTGWVCLTCGAELLDPEEMCLEMHKIDREGRALIEKGSIEDKKFKKDHKKRERGE